MMGAIEIKSCQLDGYGKSINTTKIFTDISNYFTRLFKDILDSERIFSENIIKLSETYSPIAINTEYNRSMERSKISRDLKQLGVSIDMIDIVRRDLQVSDNRNLLLDYIELSDYSESEKRSIKKALSLCESAHIGQTQKRPQDLEGLSSIPYANHPIRLAILAMEHTKVSPEIIEACLLHDVVEDTGVDEGYLRDNFSKKSVDMIMDCTQRDDESLLDFAKRVGKLRGGSRVVKCIDRMHNIIRAFTIKDPSYTARIIKEIDRYYKSGFDQEIELKPLKPLFTELFIELKKYHKLLESNPEYYKRNISMVN